MKKLLIISILILVGLALAKTGIYKLHAAEYNFYFGTDEKKVESKKEEAQEQEHGQEKVSEQEAARIAAKVSQDVYPPQKERVFLTLPKNYLSIGIEENVYQPQGYNKKFDSDSIYSQYVNIRLKYLPIFTLEAAIPLNPYHEVFNVYKGGGLLELNLTRGLSIHAAGGVLYNNQEEDKNDNYSAADQFAAYVGAGTKLRLFSHLDLWATMNAVPRSIRSKMRADILGTFGAALSF